MLDQKIPVNTGDRNKIYFLIIVIVALLGTNAYLYFRDKHESERFVSVNTEKDRLKLEVEKIEVELDNVNNLNTALTEKLQQEQQLARNKIYELKSALEKSQLTQGELSDAQREVKELRQFVKNHHEQIAILNQENSELKSERDSLVNSVNQVSKKAERLVQKNQELSKKIAEGAALKAINMEVAAFRVKNSGKQVAVKNAGSAQKLDIIFGIAPNELAEKKFYKIYIRVFDPAGNLIADENNMFDANNQQMQYSEMITLAYEDQKESYTISWVNPTEFIKGTYSVILYTDGFTMGKSSVTLK
jgi:predicted  nucleic acid-binding Zn-ribbon protein